jgi:pyruvate formate lyase activating enzyme
MELIGSKSSSEPPQDAAKADRGQVGMALRFERSSIHDGDGFRTVVFLKGCPLRCLWCSTPESQSFTVETYGDKTYGFLVGVEEAMSEVRKDSVFYFHSGGGLTVSGGEPLAQAEFARDLLKKAQSESINTAIETSLAAPFEKMAMALPHLDIVYADLKHIDPVKHKKYCGIDNRIILDNLIRTDERAKGLKLVVRIPLVPGLNDSVEDLRGAGRFCAKLKNLDHVQPLPYHRLGLETYRKMGKSYPLEEVKVPEEADMKACHQILGEYVRVSAH